MLSGHSSNQQDSQLGGTTYKSSSSVSSSFATQDEETKEAINEDDIDDNNDASGRKRHTACELCRRRKLKCSGQKPRCDSCIRLDKECKYTTIHKKSGPPRGYLRTLESRLEQMEKMLAQSMASKQNEPDLSDRKRSFDEVTELPSPDEVNKRQYNSKQPYLSETEEIPVNTLPPVTFQPTTSRAEDAERAMSMPTGSIDLFNHGHSLNMTSFPNSPSPESTSLMNIDIEEPYPNPEIMNKLVEQYFETSHCCYPFLNKRKFLSQFGMGRVKPYLLYAILMTGAYLSDSPLFHLQEQMYQRCAKYLQKAENKGFGEEILNIEFVQATLLMAIYENGSGSFGRAWLMVGKVVKAAHQNNLHDIETLVATGRDRKNQFVDVSDEVLLEEKRRTFWTVYILDKYCSAGSGWPCGIREDEIKTTLPLSDGTYGMNIAGKSVPFFTVLESPELYLKGVDSTMALSAIFAYFLSQAFTLMNKAPRPDDCSPTGEWWTKEQQLAKQIAGLIRVLPPITAEGLDARGDNMAISLQLFFHTGVLALNRAALVKLKQQDGPFNPTEFKIRCQQASTNVTRVLRMSSNLFKIVVRNPCGMFCLYTTARSFLAQLEEERDFHSVDSSPDSDFSPAEHVISKLRPQLDFLLTVLKVLRSKMFLAECFYGKLQADIRQANLSRSTGPMSSSSEFISKMQRDTMEAEAKLAYQTVSENFPQAQVDPSRFYSRGSGSSDDSRASNSPDAATPSSTSSHTLQHPMNIGTPANLAPGSTMKWFTTHNEAIRKNQQANNVPMYQGRDPLYDLGTPLPKANIANPQQYPSAHQQQQQQQALQQQQHQPRTPSITQPSVIIADPIHMRDFPPPPQPGFKTDDLDFFLNAPEMLPWNSEMILDDMIQNMGR